MKKSDELIIIKVAIERILEIATQHPLFMQDSFEKRDVNEIVREGGDACDISLIAVNAKDALREINTILNRSRNTTNRKREVSCANIP